MKPVRLAMWSGPRNISTAMMRAWENRPDCVVWDEPLYGYYLHQTGFSHPGADAVIAAQGVDWKAIVKRCAEEALPPGKTLSFQKHMTLHLLPEISRDWMTALTNCFLIREPEPVIASYLAVRAQVSLEDIGFLQQAELFDYVQALTGKIPLVIDSREFLLQPEAMLRAICDRIEVEFYAEMLSWPVGPRPSDGVWSSYWYDSVCKSSGFEPYKARPVSLNFKHQAIADQARPHYDRLFEHRIQV